MTFTQFLSENEIEEKDLSKEEVWQAAQRQIIADCLGTFIPVCFDNASLDEIIRKINERT